ncbi:DUF4474 domain-containing protein [Enterococcus sp. UD-01]|jgi:hypothetical protein|uniref:DUF4474 domain-containing protein n=1 Tax=Enterococcus sp. UD-01 TaxID=3373911 RepID=UPI0038381563
MGFHVETAEMKKALEQYQKLSKTAQEQLNSAKKSMNGIINSNAMHGQVGQAIAADINNNKNAVLVGLKNSYKLVAVDFQQTYADFVETTGEASQSAVLDEAVLMKAKTSIDKFKTEHKEKRQTIKSTYSDIADLIALSMPSSSAFTSACDESKKHLDKIIQKVNEFDNKQNPSSAEEIINVLGQQIKVSESASGLGYTDPRFMEFVSQTELAKSITELDNQLKIWEDEQEKLKEKEIMKRHPLLSVLSGDVSWERASKIISDDINNSWTAFWGDLEQNLFNANAFWISPFLGFEYNKQKDYYYTNKHSIQHIGGFNDFFDMVGPLFGMDLDEEVIYYEANGKEYRLELWKGSYGFGESYGAEVGLYYKNFDSGDFVTQVESAIPGWYPCVEEKDQIPIKNTIYDANTGKILLENDTRDYAEEEKHFWNLAIRTDSGKSKEDLFTRTQLEVKDTEMRKSMYEALKNNENIKNISIDEETIIFTWKK